MKVFVSWSGDLSKEIAKLLKTWMPCFLQSVEVFFSSDDIEKGYNWDKAISAELEECNYGIICLTKENTKAPWINFEAGAIAKTMNSRVTALMVNINPSDIQGPLSRYQATQMDRVDLLQLLNNINAITDRPLNAETLKRSFEAMWPAFEAEMERIVGQFTEEANSDDKKPSEDTSEENLNSQILEELLDLTRKQARMLDRKMAVSEGNHSESMSGEVYGLEDVYKNDLRWLCVRILRLIRDYCDGLVEDGLDLARNKKEIYLIKGLLTEINNVSRKNEFVDLFKESNYLERVLKTAYQDMR